MAEKEKRSNLLYIAFLVIVALSPTQWGREVMGVNLTAVDPLIGLALAAWVLLVLLRRTEVVVPPACLWAVVGIAAVSALSAAREWVGTEQFFVANNTRASLVSIAQLVEYLLALYVIAWAVLRHERQVRASAFLLVGVTALVVILGLVHYFQHTPVEESYYVRGSFGNRHIYGGFLAMALPLAFALALSSRNWRLRLGLIALVVLGAVTILSPGPLLGLVAALLFVAARTSSRALQGTLAGLLAFGALTAVALPRNYNENFRVPLQIRFYDDNDEGREKLRAQWMEWIAGGFIAKELPLLGVGPGNYQQNLAGAYTALGTEQPRKAMYGPDARAGRRMEPDMNSLYIVTMASTGFLGLAALLWALFFFGKAASSAARRLTDPALGAIALGVWGGMIGFGVTSIFNSLLVRGTGVVLALLFSLAAVLCFRDWASAEDGSEATRRLTIV